MSTLVDNRLVSRYILYSRFASGLVLLFGVMILVRRLLEARGLNLTDIDSFIPNSQVAAFGFILASVSSWLLTEEERAIKPVEQYIGQILGSMVALIGLSILWVFLAGAAGNIGLLAGLSFLLLGWALTLNHIGKADWKVTPSQVLAMIGFMSAFFGLLVVLYQPRIPFINYVSIHPAMAAVLILLSWAIFYSQPPKGLTAIATSQSHAGFLVRISLPAILFILPAVSYFSLFLLHQSVWEHDFALLISSATVSALAMAYIWWYASWLYQVDCKEHEAEENLNRAYHDLNIGKKRIDKYLESIADGVVAIDTEWKIILWNPTASVLSGWSKEEAVGKPLKSILKLIREKDRTEGFAFIQQAMETKKRQKMDKDVILVTKDGRDIPVGNSAAPIFDEQGEVTGAIIVLHDVAEEHRFEQVKSEFVTLASHQLRTPLTAVSGYTEMLYDEKAGKLAPKQKEYLDAVRQACSKMNALVNAILNVSRIDLGVFAIEPKPINFLQIAETALSEHLLTIKQKKLDFQKDFDTSLPTINADPKLTEIIFLNLISNAIKYTPAGGRFALSIKRQDPNVEIKIQDTGVGIPQDVQPKIFTKLFRADNARSQDPEGTGIGLYIVKSIVEAAGGRIWFESMENKGSTFYVTLPLAGMKKREGAKGLT